MSLSLNRYREYFDPSSKEGIVLLNNAIYNFQSPLEGADKIALQSKDAQKLHDTVLRLATQFGYDFMIKNMPTTHVVTPGANPGDPPIITFADRINLLETYAANNIECCRRNWWWWWWWWWWWRRWWWWWCRCMMMMLWQWCMHMNTSWWNPWLCTTNIY